MLVIGLAGCNRTGPMVPPVSVSDTPQPQTSSSPAETAALPPSAVPTATTLPAAIRINGSEISVPEYESGLAQLQAAKDGAELTPEDKQQLQNSLVDEALLAEAAFQNGFQLDDAGLQARIDALTQEKGGQAGLDAWMQANGYTSESFRLALRRSIAAAWMRDRIITEVPLVAEQVHARQILLYNADEAVQVYAQLQNGSSFGNLAVQYDPITRGDLGWFPRGELLDPKLDDPVFSLTVDGYTPVIETAAGFHIIQVLEREPERLLSAQSLLKAQARALQDWLQQQRSEAKLEVLLP